jgi:hypothetical protein
MKHAGALNDVLCCADVDFDDYHVWAALDGANYRPHVVSIEVSCRMAACLHQV